MSTHLIIGDAHAKPGVPVDRFRWLGRMCLDLQPDVIIDIGDWADMESLCSYDVGKRCFEGRRYNKDVEVAIMARQAFEMPLSRYNFRRASNKKKLYTPRKVALIGNHENRISRATELTPALEGTISIEDLKAHEFGWEVHPFLESVEIDGVHYSHYFTSGVMGRPISGEYPAATLLKKQYASCTVGHIHTRDFAERTTANGRRIQGLVAGCFFPQIEAYAGPANDMWWRGVVVKRNVQDGTYDPEFISLEELERRYA